MNNIKQINKGISELKYKEYNDNTHLKDNVIQLVNENFLPEESSKFFDGQANNFIAAVLTYLIVNEKHHKIIKISDVKNFFECIDIENEEKVTAIYDFEGDLLKSALMIQIEKLYFFNDSKIDVSTRKYINESGTIMCKMCKNANKTFTSIIQLILNKIN